MMTDELQKPRQGGRRRTALARARLCVPVLVIVFAGCSGGGEDEQAETDAAASVTVNMENFKFLPPDATLKSGGTVTFANRDKAPHTAENDSFDTGRLDRGEAKRIKFDEPGTYEYFCDFHRFMTAKVRVTG